MYPPTGYTPLPLAKHCIRCGAVNHDMLRLLCENCRDADLLLPEAAALSWPLQLEQAALAAREDDADREAEIHNARYGY